MDYRNPHAPGDDSGANTPASEDARSLNGDAGEEVGEMQIDGAGDERPARVVNAEVAHDLLAIKTAHPSRADDGDVSNQSEAGADVDEEDHDMDVDVEDGGGPATSLPGVAGASALGTSTLPSTVAPAHHEELPLSAVDVESAREKEVGLREREAEDVAAETSAEIAGGRPGPPAA